MKAGVAVFFTQYSITPIRAALALEERGYESLWAPEHSHIPVSRNSDFPKGGVLPEKYQDVMDPFVTLSVAATVTTSLKIATGICLVVQRDPIQTAKLVASLDQISAGRFLFGVEDDLTTLQRYRDAGVQRVVFSLLSSSEKDILLLLDKYASLMTGLN